MKFRIIASIILVLVMAAISFVFHSNESADGVPAVAPASSTPAPTFN